jgi:hypothetical protein
MICSEPYYWKLSMQLSISVHTIVSRIWLFLITQSFSLAIVDLVHIATL